MSSPVHQSIFGLNKMGILCFFLSVASGVCMGEGKGESEPRWEFREVPDTGRGQINQEKGKGATLLSFH